MNIRRAKKIVKDHAKKLRELNEETNKIGESSAREFVGKKVIITIEGRSVFYRYASYGQKPPRARVGKIVKAWWAGNMKGYYFDIKFGKVLVECFPADLLRDGE